MKNYQTPPVDVTEKSIQILKTVLLLDRAYSAGYLTRILTANDTFGFRKEEHKQLETFGALEGENFNQLDNLIQYMIRMEYLAIDDQVYGTIVITDAGSALLENPRPMIVNRRQISPAWYEMELMINLKNLRRKLAEEQELAPFELFNNYAMQCLVKEMPGSVVEMSRIPALVNLPEECWEPVLNEIKAIEEIKAKDEASGGLYTKAHSPSHRKAKNLFEEGKSVAEIAEACKWKPSTAQNYLINLHNTGQLNLRPWIEENIAEKDLHKGVEYFQKASDGRLEVAHKTLGMDYDTLAWCRLYSQPEESLANAA
jgi:ATP-dependent DNA helicase RecQ